MRTAHTCSGSSARFPVPVRKVRDQGAFLVDVWHDSIKVRVSTKQKSI